MEFNWKKIRWGLRVFYIGIIETLAIIGILSLLFFEEVELDEILSFSMQHIIIILCIGGVLEIILNLLLNWIKKNLFY